MATESIWRGTVPGTRWLPLASDTQADVVVVGGGITGVTVAWLLASAGRSVVLLEAGRLAGGDTGGSTGNLYQTVSGGLHEVVAKWDEETARAVVRSRTGALEFIEQRCAALGADCAFRRCDQFLYAGSEDAEGQIRQEYEAVRNAGIAARLESGLPAGPVPARGPIVVMPGQAQLHPAAYVLALAGEAAGRGARICEESPVMEVDGDGKRVRTDKYTVTARHIVLATHSPLGMHRIQIGMLARREYGLAFRSNRPFPPGIFWARGQDRLSMRGLDGTAGNFIICIGQQGKTGQHDAVETLAKLEQSVARRLGLKDPEFHWSAQHFHSPDHLPYIGADSSGCHVATGFGTDGLTYGTVAALIIADTLLDRPNLWRNLYRADRLDLLKSAGGTAEVTAGAAKAFAHDLLGREKLGLDALKPGQGAVVEHQGDTVAAYLDANGQLHLLSPICSHMKCRVRWNALETSWDCPCHGSRYAPDGQVLEGPAPHPLRRIEVSGSVKSV